MCFIAYVFNYWLGKDIDQDGWYPQYKFALYSTKFEWQYFARKERFAIIERLLSACRNSIMALRPTQALSGNDFPHGHLFVGLHLQIIPLKQSHDLMFSSIPFIFIWIGLGNNKNCSILVFLISNINVNYLLYLHFILNICLTICFKKVPIWTICCEK